MIQENTGKIMRIVTSN